MWDELKTMAMLGTRNAKAPSVPTEIAALCEGSTEEQSALRMLGVSSLWRRSGYLPQKVDDPVSVAPENLRPRADLSATYLLKLAIKHSKELLALWIDAANRAKVRVPEELLPQFIQKADPAQAGIANVLDSTGMWLLEQNPQWASSRTVGVHSREDLLDLWKEPDQGVGPKGQARILSALCDLDPEAGIEALQAEWASEGGELRLLGLQVVAPLLSKNQVPWIRGLLKDRKADVRRLAQELLMIHESSFRAFTMETIQSCLKYESAMLTKGKLSVVPLEKVSDDLKAFGFTDKASTELPKMGPQAALLYQLVRLVDPKHWMEAWKLTPPKIITLLRKHEWKDALLHGLLDATVLYKNSDWAMQFLELRDELHRYDVTSLLMVSLDSGSQCSLFKSSMEKKKAYDCSELASLLPKPWPEDLCKSALQFMNKSQGITVLSDSLFHLALGLPETLFEKALVVRGTDDLGPSETEKYRDRFLAVVEFRNKLRNTL